MTDRKKKSKPVGMPGSIAANFHEGSRSEYLAQYVFSSFGTAIPVPHQEDSGLDIYCTLLERDGQRAWPRAYYSVQVKSTMEPWVFDGAESVRWIIEHPLPIFLCVVQKSEARILVYHTTPRFAVWALPTRPARLELRLGTGTQGRTVQWLTGDIFDLGAPILNFTIQEVLKSDFRVLVAEVLKHWIDYDVGNLDRIRNGIPFFWVPHDYETNTKGFTAWTGQGGRFREDTLRLAQLRMKEILGLLATHHYREMDIVNAAIYAMVLRQLSPAGYSSPSGPSDTGTPHDPHLHDTLNKLFRMESSGFQYEACDSLLKMLKDELARHGISASSSPSSEGISEE